MEQINEFESTSQANQDKFAWVMNDRRTNGIFLDVGCNDPVKHSNTYALEQMGWNGLLVDIQTIPGLGARKADFLIADAVTADWPTILDLYLRHQNIHYLSLDCDEATTSALQRLLALEQRYATITVEHDAYRFGTGNRDRQRALLKQKGYDLVCSDVCIPPGPGIPGQGGPFEDWWVWPPSVNMQTAEQIRCDGRLHSQIFNA
jgi:hypothetical protein